MSRSPSHSAARAEEAAARRPGRGLIQGGLAIAEQGLVGGTNFLAIVALGRWAGAEELGVFALCLTATYLLIAVQESLITLPYTIFLPRTAGEERRRYQGGTLLSCLLLAGAAGIVVAMAAGAFWLGGGRSPAAVVAALAVAVPCWLLRETARRFAFAEMRLRAALAVSLAVAALQLAGLALLILAGLLSAATALLSVAAANGIAALAWLLITWNSRLFTRRELTLAARRHWRIGKWMFAAQGVSTLASQAVPWIAALYLGTAAAGVLAACESIIRLANPVVVALTNLLTPHTAQALAAGGSRAVDGVVIKATVAVAVFMGLFAAAIGAAGGWLLGALYGGEYSGYGLTLLLLALAHASARLCLGAGRGLMVFERTKDCLKADVLDFVAVVAPAFALTPWLGVNGAAAAALCGGVVISAATFWLYVKSPCRKEWTAEVAAGEHLSSRFVPAPAESAT